MDAAFSPNVRMARLGDRVGAALSFARMREAIELSADKRREFANFLAEAAENALAADDDASAAERHLTVALRLAPNDERLARRYREVAARVAERARQR